MKKVVTISALCMLFTAAQAFAHHPAADMVDAEIYENIEEAVADTPHATMTFDDTGTTTITVDSVSDAEELLDDDTLLAAFSILGEEVEPIESLPQNLVMSEYYVEEETEDPVVVTITFGEYVDPYNTGLIDESDSGQGNRYSERDDWGRKVMIQVNRVVPGAVYVEGDDSQSEK